MSFKQQLDWINRMSPITVQILNENKSTSYKGVSLAYCGHIEPKVLGHIEFFYKLGMKILVTPCVPSLNFKESFQYLKNLGIETYGEDCRSWEELDIEHTKLLSQNPTHIFDIGGNLIKKAHNKKLKIMAASEATSSGINILKGLNLSFPVFNWNEIPFKNLMHNRYEVAPGIWYAFRKVTGLDICRLKVGVVGYGPVGKGVSSLAQSLGANVHVYDQSSTRLLEAASEGYKLLPIDEQLQECDVVVTACGADSIITDKNLINAKNNLILLNAGHGNKEININRDYFSNTISTDIDEYIINNNSILLLANGNLLNLACAGGSAINTFDLFNALMASVIKYICNNEYNHSNSLLDLPKSVYQRIEELAIKDL